MVVVVVVVVEGSSSGARAPLIALEQGSPHIRHVQLHDPTAAIITTLTAIPLAIRLLLVAADTAAAGALPPPPATTATRCRSGSGSSCRGLVVRVRVLLERHGCEVQRAEVKQRPRRRVVGPRLGGGQVEGGLPLHDAAAGVQCTQVHDVGARVGAGAAAAARDKGAEVGGAGGGGSSTAPPTASRRPRAVHGAEHPPIDVRCVRRLDRDDALQVAQHAVHGRDLPLVQRDDHRHRDALFAAGDVRVKQQVAVG